jgi:hypothetical protein
MGGIQQPGIVGLGEPFALILAAAAALVHAVDQPGMLPGPTSQSLAPASINPAAANRTCSRRSRSAAVSPPPSGYLMHPAYRTAGQPSPAVTPAIEDL